MLSSQSSLFKNDNNKQSASNERKVRFRFYLDFDGTLTNCDGKATINSPAYKSLLQIHDSKYFAHTTKFLDSDSMHNIIINDLLLDLDEDYYNSPFKMAEGASEFLEFILKRDDTEVIIISRNREEYIKAILATQVDVDIHSVLENQKLKIIDVIQLTKSYRRSKLEAAEAIQSKVNHDHLLHTIVCDDDPEDACDMGIAVFHTDGNYNKVMIPRATPGKFNFKEIKGFINEKTAENTLSQPSAMNLGN